MENTGTKRKVFISHYRGDKIEVDEFIDHFANVHGVFTPYVLGANDNDEFINSADTAYVMTQIRKKYLADTTVTIVLIGSCTHSRRYVDWEIKSSLQRGENELPNGLLGILLPSMGTSGHLPERFQANFAKDNVDCYARYRNYPDSPEQLRKWIDDAYEARTARAHFISNARDKWGNNNKCIKCAVTH